MNENVINTKKQPGFRIGKFILSLLMVIFVISAFWGLAQFVKSMRKPPEIVKKTRPTLAVMVAPAKVGNVILEVNVGGETRPRTELDLVPEVAGKIVYVSPKFVSGGLFEKGDLLLKIDPSDYEVAVVRAEAAVARAQQVLMREKKEGEIARQDWEDLGEGRQASDLTLRIPQLKEAQANLQSAKADLANAKLRLMRTEVRAPFDGRVREKIADIGQYVGPGARLGRIFSTDIMEVRLALSDADLARLDLPLAFIAKSRFGAPDVEISAIVGGKKRIWKAKLMRTDAAYDRQTRSLYAIVEVLDPYGKGASEGVPLAPGLYVNATIMGKKLDNVIIIPREGLRPNEEVFIINDKGLAESKKVTVLDTNPKRAVLKDGLDEGDFVIVSAIEKSQMNLKFQGLDINNPDNVLIEPPKDTEKKKEKTDPAKAKAEMIKARKEFMAKKAAYKRAQKQAKSKKPDNKKSDNKTGDK